MLRKARRFAILAALVPLAVTRADDTDIYMVSATPGGATSMIMFSIDYSPAAGATYAGCSQVGAGVTMCGPAQYFANNCPTCVLPGATEPLTYFHVMRYALRMVLLETSNLKVGLMLNHNHESNCAGPRPSGTLNAAERCSNGAYLARGFKPVDQVQIPADPLLGIPASTVPGPNLAEFLSILDSLPVPQGGLSHPYQGKEVLFEFFRYLTGQGVYNGHNGYGDYATDDTQNVNEDGAAHDWDAAAELAGNYVSPIPLDFSCGKIFSVNFVLQGATQESDSDAAIDADVAGGMVGLDFKAPNNKLENVIKYLYDVDLARQAQPFGSVPAISGKQNVSSYFFGVPTPLDSNPPTFDRTMNGYSKLGGTGSPMAFAGDPDQVVGGLRAVLSRILSVSTSFAPGAVPVNVFSRTQVLDDVYLALFQPDAASKPFWNGNLKKLESRIVEVPCAPDAVGCTPTREIRLVDTLEQNAVDSDGRIRPQALTFWTDGSQIAADPAKGVLAGRDGRHVHLGGAGQKIPGYISGAPGLANSAAGARQMYVYPGSGTSLQPFSADLTSALTYQTPLGAVSAAEALSLLKEARGYDEYDEDGDLNTTEARTWMMGDPLHSRPLAINYGALSGYSKTNPAIFIAVGTNAGVMHFFRNTTTAELESGVESWAFLPADLMNIQKTLALNLPGTKRTYGFDGSPMVFIQDKDKDGTIEEGDGDRVYLYSGLRRGGRIYYALDVTNPALPKFLWRITPTSRASALPSPGTEVTTTDYAELGFSFSQPRLARLQTGVDGLGAPIIKPVLVFGGGYDPSNDYSDATMSLFNLSLPSPGSVNIDDVMGKAIFVVDAETGALVWKAVGGLTTTDLSGGPNPTNVFTHAGLKDSIPSTLSVVDTNSDGLADRIVVGDTGGNIWRADLGGPPDRWKLSLLAKLGRHSGVGKLNDRRFFHEADFVLSRDEYGPFDGIVLGSGDREDPLDIGRERDVLGAETRTENAFYLIKDRNVTIGSGTDASPATPALLGDVTDNCLQSGLSLLCNPNLYRGWRMQLKQGLGEKMLAAPLTAATRVYFTSYLPPKANDTVTCGPAEGTGLFYAVGLKKGTAVFNYNTADGGTDLSPNSAQDRFEAMASAGIPAEVVYINLPDPGTGGEMKCALGSDLNCRSLPGATRFRTFWYRDE